MADLIRVKWESGAPFVALVERITARATRRWRGEPTEPLGHVWQHLKGPFPDGQLIDSADKLLKTIIYRKVGNFYRRRERPVSLAEVEGYSLARTNAPVVEIAFQELYDETDMAIAKLSPRRREAVLVRLGYGEFRTVNDLARCWETTAQNVRKLATKGIEELQTSLARFAPHVHSENSR